MTDTHKHRYHLLSIVDTIYLKIYYLPTSFKLRTTLRYKNYNYTCMEIFGEEMKGYATSGDSKTVHIRKWLTDNCFGDYYTRGGLDYKQREMITCCFLYAQGGCKPQAKLE